MYVLRSFCLGIRIDVRAVVCDKVAHSCTAKRELKTNRVLQLLARVFQVLAQLGLAFCALQGLDGGGAKVISAFAFRCIGRATVVVCMFLRSFARASV